MQRLKAAGHESITRLQANDYACAGERLSDGSYRDIISISRASNQQARVVVTSRLADWDEYLDALHHGAFDLITSPCRPTDVVWAIVQARREEHEPAGFVAITRTASATA